MYEMTAIKIDDGLVTLNSDLRRLADAGWRLVCCNERAVFLERFVNEQPQSFTAYSEHEAFTSTR